MVFHSKTGHSSSGRRASGPSIKTKKAANISTGFFAGHHWNFPRTSPAHSKVCRTSTEGDTVLINRYVERVGQFWVVMVGCIADLLPPGLATPIWFTEAGGRNGPVAMAAGRQEWPPPGKQGMGRVGKGGRWGTVALSVGHVDGHTAGPVEAPLS